MSKEKNNKSANKLAGNTGLMASIVLGAVIIAAAIFMTFAGSAGGSIGSKGAMSKAEVETIVEDFLMAKPSIILEAVEKYRVDQQAVMAVEEKETIANLRSYLKENPVQTVYGNPDGDIVMIEFMDYQCGYCKRVFPDLVEFVEQDGNVHWVIMEMPILGEGSRMGARAALAVLKQDPEKYFAFHRALMQFRGRVGEPIIRSMASALGLDLDQLFQDMESPEIKQHIDKNLEWARNLKITGTPAFVIGDGIVRGAISQEQMRQAVATVREARDG